MKLFTNIEINATPTSPAHGARLQDVYDIVGAKMKDAVVAATTENLPGTYDSTAKTLTASANGALPAIDGVTLAADDRVLVQAQTDGTQNGIYAVTVLGDGSAPWTLTRAADFDSASEIFTGVKVHVVKGTSYRDLTFVLTTDNPALDTSPLIFALDSGKIQAVKQQVFDIAADASTTLWTFNHGFNSQDVTVDIVEQSAGFPTVWADVTRPTVNTVSVSFAAPIGASGPAYKVIVRGQS
ncbi:MAG: hypothetical protein LBW85_08525 [Deltaproteobacteria bacterium]|jgi:hypothetical protein|nr:hypothetical protein [Deltaproteobacteria bacterium]